ncbi:hypothetical protein IPL85_01735 [Candidatus Saccharibacteria bacterium]|nr:MAG: hypothetical protein IPL85_01735 [Candidatus Saccharibacteria bacterium]
MLVAFAVFARLVPHPANFAPLAAVALFSGAILPRRWALVVPVIAMVTSDIIIGLHPLVLYTWGSFALIALIAGKYLTALRFSRVVASSVGASVLFFLVTNFGVWMQGLMYPKTGAGLIQCYINAIPFFRGTLLGDLFYSAMLFGLYAFFVASSQAKAPLQAIK